MNVVAFILGLAAASAIVALSALQVAISNFQFWPPPSASSWQKGTFRMLFRVFFYSTVFLSVVDFQPSALWRYVTGGTLLIFGLVLALRWTNFLGWRDSFGEATKLKTSGPFAWSRNPIYLATIVGMIGWALAVNSLFVSVLLAIWAVLYILAPYLEEPWLKQEFGKEYCNYMARTPRFLRLRK